MKQHQFISVDSSQGRCPTVREYEQAILWADSFPHKSYTGMQIWIAHGTWAKQVYWWLQQNRPHCIDVKNQRAHIDTVLVYCLTPKASPENLHNTQECFERHICSLYMQLAYLNTWMQQRGFHQCMINSVSREPDSWNQRFSSHLGTLYPVCFVAHHTHPEQVVTRSSPITQISTHLWTGTHAPAKQYWWPSLEPSVTHSDEWIRKQNENLSIYTG